MLKKIFAGALALVLLLSAVGCEGKNEPYGRYTASFLTLFDTVTIIVGYAESEAAFESAVGELRDELEQYHQLYDIYNEYEGLNNLKTVNDRAGTAPVEVDSRIIDLLLFAEEAGQLTDGRVNVTMGAVLSLWHDYRTAGIDNPESAELPPRELLEEAARHTDLSNLVVDREAGTVYLFDPQCSLDVGAVAKGYACARLCEFARERGFERFLISIGGNTCAVGPKTEQGEPWTIGIEDPYGGEDYLHRVLSANLAVVTSGDYQRYYTVDGRRYHHIIDPDTLLPAERYNSVSVLAGDSGLADALSTALFVLPLEQGLELVESLEGVEALWVSGGEETMSSGFAEHLA